MGAGRRGPPRRSRAVRPGRNPFVRSINYLTRPDGAAAPEAAPRVSSVRTPRRARVGLVPVSGPAPGSVCVLRGPEDRPGRSRRGARWKPRLRVPAPRCGGRSREPGDSEGPVQGGGPGPAILGPPKGRSREERANRGTEQPRHLGAAGVPRASRYGPRAHGPPLLCWRRWMRFGEDLSTSGRPERAGEQDSRPHPVPCVLSVAPSGRGALPPSLPGTEPQVSARLLPTCCDLIVRV